MIVGGIVITNGWWIGAGSETNLKNAPMGSGRSPSLPSVNVGPSPAVVQTIELDTGWFGRPGPAQRAENRERMLTETVEAFAKYGGIALTFMFGNPASKLYAGLVLVGAEDPLWEGQS